jgi:hypothetical protein
MENTGYKNTLGTVGMARTDDPNSATSQFYFNLTDNPGFDGNGYSTGYTVFGGVIGGWNVVRTISQTMTYAQPYQSFPYTSVNILSSSVYSNPTATMTETKYEIKTVTDLGNTPIVVLTGQRNDFSIISNTDGSLDIQNIKGNFSSVNISDVGRVVFYNPNTDSYGSWLAYDMHGDAGKIAELIGSAFGRSFISVANFVNIGLQYLEQEKMSYAQLCDLVVATPLFQQLAGGSDNTAFVNLVYKNVVGQAPDANSLAYFTGLLDNHAYTQGQLLELATGSSDMIIDLVGLSHTGINF